MMGNKTIAFVGVVGSNEFWDLPALFGLLGDPPFQSRGGPAENFMPARLQFAANVRLLTDRSDVDGNPISQGGADGLAAENPGHSVNFEFGVTEFARGLKIGQHGSARRVKDREKASLSTLYRRRRRRQRRHQDLDPAFAEIGLRLRRIALTHEVHLQTVPL